MFEIFVGYKNFLFLCLSKKNLKKLLYITNAIDGSGGLERVLSIKTKVLVEKYGYEIHIITISQRSSSDLFFPFSENIILHHIEVSRSAIQYLYHYVKGIKKVISEIRPDVILVCDDGLKAFFLPMILGKKIPIIYERHASILISHRENFMSYFKHKLVHLIMKSQMKNFAKFVILTESNKKEWKGNNLVVIPNPTPYWPDLTSKLDKNKIIAVGSHSYNKGYDRLLNIWKKIEEEQKEWELHIYGQWHQSTFIELAEKLQLQSVFFHRPIISIHDAYLESSILVFPSRSEGFGMVLIEAMSFGIPCVSFDCPTGPSDIIKHEEDGFLVTNGNEKEFAEKLQMLMMNEILRKEMGGNARRNVERFMPENVLKMWDELIKGLSQ